MDANKHESKKRAGLEYRRPLFLLLIFVAIFSLGMIFRRGESDLPIFDGKNLSEWLEMKGGIEPLPNEAQEAVRKMGTNALPHLLALMQHEDSAAKNLLYRHLPGVWNLRAHLTPHYVIQDRGVQGIKALGPAAKPALPILAKMMHEDCRFDAAEALVTVGNEGIGIVADGLHSTNEVIRYSAITWLSGLESIKPEWVTHFRQALNDSDSDVREAATNALAKLDGAHNDLTQIK